METSAADGPLTAMGMGMGMGMEISRSSVESWWAMGGMARVGVVAMASVGGVEPLVRH